MPGRFQDINFELDKLPTMPVVASQMMELINNPETSASQLAGVVSKDPAVSARVLKIANSSFYSMSRQVTSMSTAVVILGERTLRNLVLAASMRGMHSHFGKVEQMLWEDSMVCALASRFLAGKLALVDPEEAFMAGLFRHIGLVVLNNQESRAAEFIINSLKANNQEMGKEEREAFGATHAEIGAAVLEHWKLSEVLSLVALHHSDVDFARVADEVAVKMTCIVNIAGRMPGHLGIFGAPRVLNFEEMRGLQHLDVPEERLLALIEDFVMLFNQHRSEFLS